MIQLELIYLCLADSYLILKIVDWILHYHSFHVSVCIQVFHISLIFAADESPQDLSKEKHK